MDSDNEVERLRELLRETEAICSKQAGIIFELDADIKTMKMRMHNLLEETTGLKNKLEYYKHTARQIRIPIEDPAWMADEPILPAGEGP